MEADYSVVWLWLWGDDFGPLRAEQGPCDGFGALWYFETGDQLACGKFAQGGVVAVGWSIDDFHNDCCQSCLSWA